MSRRPKRAKRRTPQRVLDQMRQSATDPHLPKNQRRVERPTFSGLRRKVW